MKKNRIAFYIAQAILILHFCLIKVTFAAPVVRVAALAFGTVHWELTVIKQQGLDVKNGFDLEIITIANKDASHILLMGDAVDMTVTDWLWVLRQRADKHYFLQLPYSKLTGGLVVQNARSLDDLAGKKLGVAGGPLDKSWLLVQAYLKELNLKTQPELVFAAPPLLNELFLQNKLDAVLNYWNYNDLLIASGKKLLLPVNTLFTHFGLTETPPMTGWTYRQSWGEKNSVALQGFIKADLAAKKLMQNDDAIWTSIRSLMVAPNEAAFLQLRNTYRSGIVYCYKQSDKDNAKKLFQLLQKFGGNELLGVKTVFSSDIFASPDSAYDCAP